MFHTFQLGITFGVPFLSIPMEKGNDNRKIFANKLTVSKNVVYLILLRVLLKKISYVLFVHKLCNFSILLKISRFYK